MIGKDQIAEALRHADALAEEHNDIPAYWRERGVDIDGLTYVAMQHGLRAVILARGENPNLGQKPVAVSLTPAEQRLQMIFASSFMSGFAARDRIKEN